MSCCPSSRHSSLATRCLARLRSSRSTAARPRRMRNLINGEKRRHPFASFPKMCAAGASGETFCCFATPIASNRCHPIQASCGFATPKAELGLLKKHPFQKAKDPSVKRLQKKSISRPLDLAGLESATFDFGNRLKVDIDQKMMIKTPPGA